jgi:hypothetical protein
MVVKNLGLAAAALSWRQTRSAPLKRLDVKDPAAIALGYVEM